MFYLIYIEVRFLGWGLGGCVFKSILGGFVIYLSLNIIDFDKVEYLVDFISCLIWIIL